jgi:hypothetical protein
VNRICTDMNEYKGFSDGELIGSSGLHYSASATSEDVYLMSGFCKFSTVQTTVGGACLCEVLTQFLPPPPPPHHTASLTSSA